MAKRTLVRAADASNCARRVAIAETAIRLRPWGGRPQPDCWENPFGAGGRIRTDTGCDPRWILSPTRLPIPPLRQQILRHAQHCHSIWSRQASCQDVTSRYGQYQPTVGHLIWQMRENCKHRLAEHLWDVSGVTSEQRVAGGRTVCAGQSAGTMVNRTRVEFARP